MDYSLCKSLSYNSDGIDEIAVIYDIVCQYSKFFESRVGRCSLLSLPAFKKLLYGVGKFHLGAHIDECFFQFSLNFILGMGQVDGEILEALWSAFNKVSSTARAMSRFHRLESLDTHMNDSNWMKIIYSREYFIKISVAIALNHGMKPRKPFKTTMDNISQGSH